MLLISYVCTQLFELNYKGRLALMEIDGSLVAYNHRKEIAHMLQHQTMESSTSHINIKNAVCMSTIPIAGH